jgi:hypothetical protein
MALLDQNHVVRMDHILYEQYEIRQQLFVFPDYTSAFLVSIGDSSSTSQFENVENCHLEPPLPVTISSFGKSFRQEFSLDGFSTA